MRCWPAAAPLRWCHNALPLASSSSSSSLLPAAQVFVSYLKPLEWVMNHEEHNGHPVRPDNGVYVKLITHVPDANRVVGVHYLGPGAGEVMQVGGRQWVQKVPTQLSTMALVKAVRIKRDVVALLRLVGTPLLGGWLRAVA